MLSIRAQLTALFVVPLALATGVVAFVGHRIAKNAVEQYAVSILQSDAQVKRDNIMALLQRRRAAAANLLENADANCAISGGMNAICAREALEQFAAAQRASCAVLQTHSIMIAAHRCRLNVGGGAANVPFVFGQSRYVVAQKNKDLGISVIAEFPLADIERILASGEFGVGSSALLLNSTNQLLEPPDGPQMPSGINCSTGHVQDQRGRKFMLRSMGLPLVGGCVVSQIAEQEALAPTAMLRRASWLMVMGFVVAALLIAFGAASLISSPLARLTRRAMLLREGDLDSPLPLSGPAEVRKLSLALSDAAAGLKRARRNDLERERADAESSMAAALAHQINNPLTSVISALALISERMETEQDQKLLAFAREDAARIASITRQLVALHRGSNTPGLLQVPDLLNAVIDQHRSGLDKRQVTVRRELAPASIAGFQAELQQALMNIFENALAAATPGSEIVVRCARAREINPPFRYGVRITIHDRGAAVEPKLRSRLMHPFTSSSSVRGKGLGLWAANAAVQKHHGKLRVKSCSGITTVSIFLPHIATVAA